MTERGLWCPAGGFHIDPAVPVPVAVVTHAHADHARPGSALYYCAEEGRTLLARRMPPDARIVGVDYAAPFHLGGARVSFHPAGHLRGSAQVRVEVGGSVWVASGDYKRQPDPTCTPFEVVHCDVFITESTFALPIYAWDPTERVVAALAAWWRDNAARGQASIVCTYALGKAQRLLAELARLAPGSLPAGEDAGPPRVLLHGLMEPLTRVYRDAGVAMIDTAPVLDDDRPRARRARGSFAGALIVAPPSAVGTPWVRRFGAGVRTAFASGWMLVRGVRRRRGFDAGFVISDHADWPDLLRTVRETGATRVLTTHGSGATLARFLREQGVDASPLQGPPAPAGEDDA
ncbi:MAG: ligase-associated DNA damage response exonuclease [Planctomycetota bacterium]|nr:ligase-associated DNA damage response exonuclease [Planctomycetota bacterium]